MTSTIQERSACAYWPSAAETSDVPRAAFTARFVARSRSDSESSSVCAAGLGPLCRRQGDRNSAGPGPHDCDIPQLSGGLPERRLFARSAKARRDRILPCSRSAWSTSRGHSERPSHHYLRLLLPISMNAWYWTEAENRTDG